MKEDIINLFCNEYSYDFDNFQKKFENLYDDNFQKNKCIRVVALYNDEVVGFQSFFYWPYKINNSNLESYQSGNSIVKENFRGLRIFSMMLDKIENMIQQKNIDFIIGFPVEKSIGSFKRKKWINKFNLIWYVKPISFNPMISFKKPFINLSNEKQFFDLENKEFIILENSRVFEKYRINLNKGNIYFSLQKNNIKLELCCKLKKRRKILNELIIGNIQFNEFSEEAINEAFIKIIEIAKKSNSIHFISFAVSENIKVFKPVLLKFKFKSMKKKIFFIFKNFNNINFDNLLLFRADIDTW